METRIAVVGIIVEYNGSIGEVNEILHEYSNFIVGRMGIPYKDKDINIITIVVDADMKTISALSGKLGMVKGINVKTLYSRNITNEKDV